MYNGQTTLQQDRSDGLTDVHAISKMDAPLILAGDDTRIRSNKCQDGGTHVRSAMLYCTEQNTTASSSARARVTIPCKATYLYVSSAVTYNCGLPPSPILVEICAILGSGLSVRPLGENDRRRPGVWG